jgi:hypothetical protein
MKLESQMVHKIGLKFPTRLYLGSQQTKSFNIVFVRHKSVCTLGVGG